MHSSVAIFQQHQRMEFIFQNAFGIQQFVLLGWSLCCKHFTVVITYYLTVTKYPFHKWKWSFSLFTYICLSAITFKTFTELWVTLWVSCFVFVFCFFFCNFHFLQTLQTILNNYTTRQNILANYKITLWVSCFVFVYPQTVSYVPNVAHVFGFTIHDYSLTIIRRWYLKCRP